jgi:hypothetical protein
MNRASSVFLGVVSITCVALFASSGAAAQNLSQNAAPDLAALQQTAQKRYAEWEALATDMNDRMARMLPCDPRAQAALTEVSRASEARLGALGDYLRAASSQAFAETAAARNLLNAEEKRAVEVSLEGADAGQQQTAVDTQSDALAQSVKQRTALEAPQKLLTQISAMIHQRAAAAEQQAGAADAAVALLRDLVAKFDARDAALREEFAASEAERTRWNGYYSARRSRAQIECTITQIGAASSNNPAKGPNRPRGKQ